MTKQAKSIPKFANEAQERAFRAHALQPGEQWTNSLGMVFVPVAGADAADGLVIQAGAQRGFAEALFVLLQQLVNALFQRGGIVFIRTRPSYSFGNR